jgi:hypothetical protein
VGVSLSLASALLRPDCAALKELDRLPVKFELAIGQNGQVGRLALVANAAPPACPWAFTLPAVLKIASCSHATLNIVSFKMGVLGQVWLKSGDTRDTSFVANVLAASEFAGAASIRQMVEQYRTASEFAGAASTGRWSSSTAVHSASRIRKMLLS